MRKFLNVILFALLFVSLSAKSSTESFKSKIKSLTTLKTESQLATNADFPANYFEDFWIGNGYTCNTGSSIPEDINITYTDGGEFIATKVNGDDCVNRGQITFRGNLQPTFSGSASIGCKITLGSPSNPQSTVSSNCSISIIDSNNFKVNEWGLTFRRGRLDWPHDYWLGYWIGTGYSCNTGKSMPEDIRVYYTDKEMQAIKVMGDDCVNKGKVTFRANLVPDTWRNMIPCTITLGSPTNPQSTSSSDCSLEIVDINNFKVNSWGLTFTRGRLPQNNYPYDFFKGGWYGKNYSCGDITGLTQEIDIGYTLGEAIAIKIQGDKCVAEGSMTFKLVLQDEFAKCDSNWNIPCAIVFGTTTAPSSITTHKCHVNIIDADNFEIPEYGLTYTRKQCTKVGS